LVGALVGAAVGVRVGLAVGAAVGVRVGLAVGAAVGAEQVVKPTKGTESEPATEEQSNEEMLKFVLTVLPDVHPESVYMYVVNPCPVHSVIM
jgi:phage tail tape-measure protein